ncbi:MAG: hypothetical protein L3J87_02310 [Thermoplasmata archaeon]|nr:hypothetical protein [Thermoplasmata archaeon]MCI4344444.1 hypothetical protein [Thermoplasmata archaeon]
MASEASLAVAELERFRPSVVGVGLSAEELTGLTDYFVGTDSEPLVPLTSAETAEIRGLARFGEVRVPHPTFLAALEWARRAQVKVAPLDPSEEALADQFTEHVSYLELVRRTVRERGMIRHPPEAASADEFVLAWDHRLTPGSGSARLHEARERGIADQLAKLGGVGARTVGIVDRERLAGIVAGLRSL